MAFRTGNVSDEQANFVTSDGRALAVAAVVDMLAEVSRGTHVSVACEFAMIDEATVRNNPDWGQHDSG